MKARHGVFVLGLGLIWLLMPQTARAQTGLILKYMEKDPTCKKYMAFKIRGNDYQLRWTHPVAQKMTKQCSSVSYLYCKPAWNAFDGKPMKGAAAFVKATMEVAKWGDNGKYWTWKFQYHASGVGRRAMLGSVVFKVPNAAKLIAATMDSREKITKLHTNDTQEPMQALWYLGAKQYTDTIINSLDHWDYAAHRNFAMFFLWNWKLTKAQKNKVVNHCIEKVFRGTKRKAKRSVRACLLFLGRVKTRNKKAKQYLENLLESNDGGQWAMRAAGYMGYKSVKRDLQKLLKKEHRKKTVYVGSRRKKIDAWNSSDLAVAAAVALVGMGDRKALKAIKYWASYNKKYKRPVDSGGCEAVAYEVGFASPKAKKKITKILLKALKNLERDDKRGNLRYKRAVIVGLAQAGARKVLKPLLRELRGRDQRGLLQILKGIGGAKTLWHDSRRGLVGIAVGKGGFSVRDAQKVAKYIRGRIEFYSDSSSKRFAIQAVLDIEARIKAAKK